MQSIAIACCLCGRRGLRYFRAVGRSPHGYTRYVCTNEWSCRSRQARARSRR